MTDYEHRRSGSLLNRFRRLILGPAATKMRRRAREVERDIRDEEDVRDRERWEWAEQRMILRGYAKQLREQVRLLGGTPLAEPPLDVVTSRDYTPSPAATPAKVELPPKPGIQPRPK